MLKKWKGGEVCVCERERGGQSEVKLLFFHIGALSRVPKSVWFQICCSYLLAKATVCSKGG